MEPHKFVVANGALDAEAFINNKKKKNNIIDI